MSRPSHLHRLSERQDRIHGAPPMEGEFRAEHAPTFTLEKQIARARADMGEDVWRRLNAEWDSPIDAALESYRKVRHG